MDTLGLFTLYYILFICCNIVSTVGSSGCLLIIVYLCLLSFSLVTFGALRVARAIASYNNFIFTALRGLGRHSRLLERRPSAWKLLYRLFVLWSGCKSGCFFSCRHCTCGRDRRSRRSKHLSLNPASSTWSSRSLLWLECPNLLRWLCPTYVKTPRSQSHFRQFLKNAWNVVVLVWIELFWNADRSVVIALNTFLKFSKITMTVGQHDIIWFQTIKLDTYYMCAEEKWDI